MLKLSAIAFALMVSFSLAAQQTKTDSVQVSDSAALLREIIDLLGEIKPVSYVNADITLGNRLYSIQNKGLNAKQADKNLLVYTPTVAYFHKSGFSLAAGVNFLNDPAVGFVNSQSSVSGGYNLTGSKTLAAGISYTRYFVRDTYAPYASPIQNDLYASARYIKSWLNPGIAVGYSTGYYNSLRSADTVINNIRRRLYDSATFNLKAFSIMATLSHQFKWQGVFGSADGLTFTPSLVANFGSSQTSITHKTNAPNLLNFLNRRGRVPRLSTTPFQTESAGITLNLVYLTGNFSFEPQFYLDYYIPATTANRFTQVITFTAGYSF